MHQINFYVPVKDFEQVTQAMFAAGAGVVGEYEQCCWYTLGTGQFKPSDKANPHIGQAGELETVEEYKVELVCEDKVLDVVVAALKLAHPYETPAFHVVNVISGWG